jgi:hypothetical protein
MNNNWKTFAIKDLKLDDAGTFLAMFAPFNAIDKQGDVTLPGAFGEQQVIISAYGHGSWQGQLPVGKGRIFESPEGGIVEGKFFLDTLAGNETYKTVKNLGAMQEWSYALPEIDFEMSEKDGKKVRVLKKIKVNEVSPVLMGAGNGTQLLDIKSGRPSQTLADQLEQLVEATRYAIDRLKALQDLRAAEGKPLGVEASKRVLIVKATLDELLNEINKLNTVSSDKLKDKELVGAMIAEQIRFTLLSTRRI